MGPGMMPMRSCSHRITGGSARQCPRVYPGYEGNEAHSLLSSHEGVRTQQAVRFVALESGIDPRALPG